MKQALIAMMIYICIFGILSIVSFSSILHHSVLFVLDGFPNQGVNIIVFVFSIGGLLKSLYHVIRIQI